MSFLPEDISPLEMTARVAEAIHSARNNSLPEYTAPARLTPIVLIDKRVMSVSQNQITALMQTLLSVYSGMYLMAINMTMNVGNVKVMRLLDQFSTDRSVLTAAGGSRWFGVESIDTSANFLPDFSLENGYEPDNYERNRADKHSDYERERADKLADKEDDLKNQKDSRKDALNNSLEIEKNKFRNVSDQDKTIHTITEESNLAVGKIIDVRITSGNTSVTIPVIARLNPISMDSSGFLAVNKANSIDKSYMSRFHQWRSGQISAADYLLCLDIIQADKKALLADKTGVLTNLRSARTKGIMATLVSGYASPNDISAMIIISKETASSLEMVLKGKLKSAHVRDNFFKNNSAMMLVVVDTIMERFTMYQRGIADYAEYTLEDIKANAKNPKGTDIDSVFKAFKLGSAPTL